MEFVFENDFWSWLKILRHGHTGVCGILGYCCVKFVKIAAVLFILPSSMQEMFSYKLIIVTGLFLLIHHHPQMKSHEKVFIAKARLG
jgi:hypothetical protein